MNARIPAVLSLALVLTLALLVLAAGCSSMPRMLGGSGDLRLVLDGEQEHTAALPAGRLLTLDMRDPGASGYVFTGTSFNAALLRLDGIQNDEGGRVRYLFTALGPGECEVLIKIRKAEPGYRPDVFKRVRLTITQ